MNIPFENLSSRWWQPFRHTQFGANPCWSCSGTNSKVTQWLKCLLSIPWCCLSLYPIVWAVSKHELRVCELTNSGTKGMASPMCQTESTVKSPLMWLTRLQAVNPNPVGQQQKRSLVVHRISGVHANDKDNQTWSAMFASSRWRSSHSPTVGLQKKYKKNSFWVLWTFSVQHWQDIKKAMTIRLLYQQNSTELVCRSHCRELRAVTALGAAFVFTLLQFLPFHIWCSHSS